MKSCNRVVFNQHIMAAMAETINQASTDCASHRARCCPKMGFIKS